MIFGGAEADLIEAEDGNDAVYGEQGIDKVYAGVGDDTVRGGTESDHLYGDDGNDTLFGEEGADYLHGHSGNDILFGEIGADNILGDAGNDVLSGGANADFVYGGAGKDTFVLDLKPLRDAANSFKDFSVRDDTIKLSKSFYKLKAGKLNKDAFFKGAHAHDGDDRVIYNPKAGTLVYDADGTGSRAEIVIAKMAKKLAFTHLDVIAG